MFQVGEVPDRNGCCCIQRYVIIRKCTNGWRKRKICVLRYYSCKPYRQHIGTITLDWKMGTPAMAELSESRWNKLNTTANVSKNGNINYLVQSISTTNRADYGEVAFSCRLVANVLHWDKEKEVSALSLLIKFKASKNTIRLQLNSIEVVGYL